MTVADCWLGYRPTAGVSAQLAGTGARVALAGGSQILRTARDELVAGLAGLTGTEPAAVAGDCDAPHILIARPGAAAAAGEGAAEVFQITGHAGPPARIVITGSTEAACLHGVFAFLRRLQAGPALGDLATLAVTEQTAIPLRLLSHWDNTDGTVERGYAGSSVFFAGGKVTADLGRVE
jgi:alpha-glucuronidase